MKRNVSKEISKFYNNWYPEPHIFNINFFGNLRV